MWPFKRSVPRLLGTRDKQAIKNKVDETKRALKELEMQLEAEGIID